MITEIKEERLLNDFIGIILTPMKVTSVLLHMKTLQQEVVATVAAAAAITEAVVEVMEAVVVEVMEAAAVVVEINILLCCQNYF